MKVGTNGINLKKHTVHIEKLCIGFWSFSKDFAGFTHVYNTCFALYSKGVFFIIRPLP